MRIIDHLKGALLFFIRNRGVNPYKNTPGSKHPFKTEKSLRLNVEVNRVVNIPKTTKNTKFERRNLPNGSISSMYLG